jgi:hypothetical protein
MKTKKIRYKNHKTTKPQRLNSPDIPNMHDRNTIISSTPPEQQLPTQKPSTPLLPSAPPPQSDYHPAGQAHEYRN